MIILEANALASSAVQKLEASLLWVSKGRAILGAEDGRHLEMTVFDYWKQVADLQTELLKHRRFSATVAPAPVHFELEWEAIVVEPIDEMDEQGRQDPQTIPVQVKSEDLADFCQTDASDSCQKQSSESSGGNWKQFTAGSDKKRQELTVTTLCLEQGTSQASSSTKDYGPVDRPIATFFNDCDNSATENGVDKQKKETVESVASSLAMQEVS